MTTLLVVLTIAIFYLSSQPLPAGKLPLPLLDKFIHFLAFAAFATITYGSLLENHIKKNLFILATLISAIYGATIEIYQYFVPGRECSFWDWFSDVLGAAFAVSLVTKIPFLQKYYAKIGE